MSADLLYYNVFDEHGNAEVEEPIAINSEEELTKMIKSNYFCVNVIQKLFGNLRANEIMLGFHNEEQVLPGIYDSIEKENYNSYRNKIVDLNVVLYANNDTELLKSIDIIGNAEDILSIEFLGLEYLLLKKIKETHRKAILSPYANRMIALAEDVCGQKFYEINVNEAFVEKIIQHQLENAESYQKIQGKIEAYNTRLKIIDIELEKLNKEVKKLVVDAKNNDQKASQKLDELKSLCHAFVLERLTIWDKVKIAFFDFFKKPESVTAVIDKREGILNAQNTFVTRLFNEEKNLLIKEKTRKSNVVLKKEKLDKSIKDKSKAKISLSKQLKDSQNEASIISKILISTDGSIIENNVDILSVKSLSGLAKENVLFMHMFPKVAQSGSNFLEEYVEMVDRSNVIRVFNPKLNCDVYPVVGSGFTREYHQYSKGDFGVLLSKGLVDKLTCLSHPSLNETSKDIFTFKEKIQEMRDNPEDMVYEALVDKSEVYGYVAMIDNIIEREEDKKIKVSKIIEAFDYLNKFNNHANKHELKSLPTIFVINGEVLEITGLKFDKYKLSPKQKDVKLDLEQAVTFVRKTFKIEKNIQKAIEVTFKRDFISEKIKNNCVGKLMKKFQTYFGEQQVDSFFNHDEEVSIEEPKKQVLSAKSSKAYQSDIIPSMWDDDENEDFKISISTK